MAGIIVFLLFGFILVRGGPVTVGYLYRLHQVKAINYPVLTAVLVAIIVVEALFPSTALTGIERPVAEPPIRYMDQTAMPDRAFTYGEVAESADWLWGMGTITRVEMKHLLQADLTALQARLRSFEDRENQLGQAYGRGNLGVALQIAIEGFEKALSELETGVPDDEITVSSANAYVSSALRSEFDAYKDAVNSRFFAASRAEREATDYVNGLEDAEAAKLKPEYVAIVEEAKQARQIWLESVSYTSAFSLTSHYAKGIPEGFSPDAPFPEFSTPIPLIWQDGELNARLFHASEAGPEPEKGLNYVLRNWWAAFTGYRRIAPRYEKETRCGIYFVDTNVELKTEYICEIAQILSIDYDITGAGCDTSWRAKTDLSELKERGTRGHDTFCKESWIFPHVNVVVTPQSMTVYPPRSVGQTSQTPPLSEWIVEVEGARAILNQPRTFPYQHGRQQLERMRLTHYVRPNIIKPRIWGDFGIDRPGRSVQDAIIGDVAPQHEFAPISFDQPFNQNSSQLFDEFFALGRSIDGYRTGMANSPPEYFSYRLLLEQLSTRLRHDTPSYGGNLADEVNIKYCRTGSVLRQESENADRSDDIRSFVESMPAPECDVYFAMSQILKQAEQTGRNGTWLWLLRF